MTKIAVVGKNLLVEMAPKEEMKGGFYMPESNKAENQVGKVLEYGNETGYNFQMPAHGYKVIVKPNAGYKVEVEGFTGDLKVISIEDVLVIFED